jgi:uncharacterized protein (TIGR03000 family)
MNDQLTTSTGPERRYVSNGLEAGRTYTYSIRAEVVRDGQTIEETQVVRLISGGTANLSFNLNGQSQNERVAETPANTKLTLRVPADARVFLAGRETQMIGEVREYATTRLVAGQLWPDYVVTVTIERDGQTLTQERRITLEGGRSQELSFEFDGETVADRLAGSNR